MTALDKFVTNLKIGFYTIVIVAMLAIVFSGLALGITDIVIGAKYLHDDYCHIHDLPKYLIAMGVFSIINFIILITKDEKPDGTSNFSKKYELLFGAISMAIAIWGMTLVWESEKANCASTLYNYAYYRTVVSVFIMTAVFASMIIFMVMMLFCACCCETCLENCIASKSAASDIEITNANTKPMPGGIGSADPIDLKKASLPFSLLGQSPKVKREQKEEMHPKCYSDMLTILDKTLNTVNIEKSVSIDAVGSTEA